MQNIDTSTPVVVLKLDEYMGLCILRSLGRLGISVHGIGTSTFDPLLFSQFYRKRVHFDFDHSSSEQAVEILQTLGKQIGRRSILIATYTETAAFVADHADALREWFIFPGNPPAIVHALCSKKGLHDLACKHSVPAPQAFFPLSSADVESCLPNIKFPVMLKGIDGRRLQIRAGVTMSIVRNADELLLGYNRMEDPAHPNLMIQGFIPNSGGADWMFNGYFDSQSDCLISFTGQKLRQAPIDIGYTSLGILKTNPTVDQMSRDFMKAIGYRGMVDIDYRYDASDGCYKILDVNPRIGSTFRLFTDSAGLDVVRTMYLDLTRQEVKPGIPVENRKWVVEDRDLVGAKYYIGRKRITFPEWLRSFRGVQEGAWFASDDLFPFAIMCLNTAGRMLRSAVKRV